jgi:hypothetical protein
MEPKASDASPSQILVAGAIAQIAQALRRSEAEIANACAVLSKHWIRTLEDWHQLGSERQFRIALPALLVKKLNQMYATCVAEKATQPPVATAAAAAAAVIECTELPSSPPNTAQTVYDQCMWHTSRWAA